MKKIDIITSCLECSWFVKTKNFCGYSQRAIVLDGSGFPDWCQLPDATNLLLEPAEALRKDEL